MNNLKYYEDGLAYDFSLFSETAPDNSKTNNVIELPSDKKARIKRRNRAAAKATGTVSAVLISVFVVAMLAAGIFLRSQITETEQKIAKVDSQISEADAQIARINFDIEQKISYKNLEVKATELGMKKMDKNQIVYIRTNEDNKASVLSGKQTAENN